MISLLKTFRAQYEYQQSTTVINICTSNRITFETEYNPEETSFSDTYCEGSRPNVITQHIFVTYFKMKYFLQKNWLYYFAERGAINEQEMEKKNIS